MSLTQLLSFEVLAQSKKTNGLSDFSIVIEYGLSYPTIKGKPSFLLSNLPANPQEETIFHESEQFEESISNVGYFGFELQYRLRSNISVGIAMQRRSGITYNSSAQFSQEKLVLSNNLSVFATGVFVQRSKIGITTLVVTSNVDLFRFEINRSTTLSFETGIGLGTSLMAIRSEIPYVLLRMQASNDFISQDDTLGPGSIIPETSKFAPFSWQIQTGFRFQFENFTTMQIGFRYISLGDFIIMEQSKLEQDLFILTTTTPGSESQNLSLSSTHAKRKLFSKDLFIRFYF